MIDGMMEHQDSNGGGGLITNGDTQWMTAGGGILHIETPPEHLVVERRPVPRPAAVGEPAAGAEVAPRRATRTSGRQGRAADHRRTAARWSGSSPARSPATPGPGSTYTPITLVHATVAPGRDARRCRGGPTSTPSSTCSPATARSAPSGARSHRPARGLRRRRHADRRGRRAPGRAARRRLDVFILGGQPIREPVVALRPVRDEHPRRGHPGVRGLPGRPPRRDPGRSTPHGGVDVSPTTPTQAEGTRPCSLIVVFRPG